MNLYDSVRGTKKVVLILGITVILAACANVSPTPAPTQPTTGTPNPTSTPAPTSTSNPTEPPLPTATFTSTETQTATPMPFVSFGSPFASDCGDGIPRIWSNDSPNGPFKKYATDDRHGHVDIQPPKGCIVANIKGAFLAPATGTIARYDIGNGAYGYHLTLPRGTFIEGILEALKFSGIEAPDLNRVSDIMLDFGHVDVPFEGNVEKGQKIGEFLRGNWTNPLPPYKLAYQVEIIYGGIEYMISPTLFKQDGPGWICYPGSPYDCKPQPLDYAKK